MKELFVPKISPDDLFSGPYFPAFGLSMEIYGVSLYSVRLPENADQKNSEYVHF